MEGRCEELSRGCPDHPHSTALSGDAWGWNDALQKLQRQNAVGAWPGWGPGRLLASLWGDCVGHSANGPDWALPAV